jgi:hypothetical protein
LRETRDLGSFGPIRIDGTGFDTWFRNGIVSIPGYTGESAALTMRVQILKAYVQGLGTLKSANLIVRVQIASDRKTGEPRIIRGVDDSLRWTNADVEIQSALDRALATLTGQIGNDVARACEQRRPAVASPQPQP